MTDQMVPPASPVPGGPPAVPPPLGPPPPEPGTPGPGPGVGVVGQPGPPLTTMLTPEEQQEIEVRDHLGMKLGETAIALCSQVAELSPGDPGQCKDMAQAVLYLTEALVLVAPLESTGETAGPDNIPGPGGGPVPLPPKHMPPQASTNFAEQQATGRQA